MIETLGYASGIVSSGTNADLRRYARWEYGTSDARWFLASGRQALHRDHRPWGIRMRYWLNSFRGFATYDVRGTDGRA